jgi:DnaJ-class molecular chaperone
VLYPLIATLLPSVWLADIVFIIKEKPHPRFTRAGNDLVYTHNGKWLNFSR